MANNKPISKSNQLPDVASLNDRICSLFGSIEGFFEFCDAKNPATSAHQFKNRTSNKGSATMKLIKILELIMIGDHDKIKEVVMRHKLYHEVDRERKNRRKMKRGIVNAPKESDAML